MSSVEASGSDVEIENSSPPQKKNKRKKQPKPVKDTNSFVGRITSVDVDEANRVFRLKGKKNKNFNLPYSEGHPLLQTALFSFANNLKVQVVAKNAEATSDDVVWVSAIKLAQKY